MGNDIKIPDKRTSAKLGQSKYPFSTMEVDDSFEVRAEKRYSISTLAKKYGDTCEKKFSVRKLVSGKLYCFRIK